MLFFFELLFFVAAITIVFAAEAWGRDTAVALGLALTVASVLARFVVGRRVPLPAAPDRAALHAAPEHARWWSETLHGWSHFNRGLLIAAAVLLAWAALGRWL